MKGNASLDRVVYVVSLFPCWSETFIVREISALIDSGVDVRIVSLKAPSEALVQGDAARLMERVRHPGTAATMLRGFLSALSRHPFPVIAAFAAVVADNWRNPSVAAKSFVALARGLEHLAWLRRFDPQLIHSHWATYPSTVAWALGSILDKPFGFTCHAHDIFVERQLLARKLADASLAVTISRYNVDWLSRTISPEAASKLKVVHCGVDLANAPTAGTSARDPLAILAVGRLDPIKGFDTLIEALALLKARGVRAHCRIVGSGPLHDALQAQAKASGVTGMLEFCGAQEQAVVRRWMQESALFVMPSQVASDGNRDGIPVALMEAMASGCGVVGTRVSGIPELIEDRENGRLVEPGDASALADAMQNLLADGQGRARLAASARQRIEQQFDARSEALRLRGYMLEATHGA